MHSDNRIVTKDAVRRELARMDEPVQKRTPVAGALGDLISF